MAQRLENNMLNQNKAILVMTMLDKENSNFQLMHICSTRIMPVYLNMAQSSSFLLLATLQYVISIDTTSVHNISRLFQNKTEIHCFLYLFCGQ